jgi:signal transduction histidine kinase
MDDIDIGKELATLIDTLPEENRALYRRGISKMVHDLRQTMSIIFTAEKLLRDNPKMPAEDIELLEAINTSCKRAMSMLTDFARPFDTGITLPLKRPPTGLPE